MNRLTLMALPPSRIATDAESMHFTGLPIPPPLNNAYTNKPQSIVMTPSGPKRRGGGRALSARARTWKQHAGNLINAQSRGLCMDGKCRIWIQIGEDSTRGDIDGRGKLVIDLLVSLDIIAGDDKKTVRSVTMEWVTGDTASVTVERIP